MDKVLMLEIVIMLIMGLSILVTYIGYSRDKKRREREKKK